MSDARTGPYLLLRETHCAGLLLVGDRAFKFKKPVDLGFLDFTTREARAEACRREVELNRRFSPDVYLGLADLEMPDHTHEPIVVMRRMPDARRLSHLVNLGVDVRDDLRQLARRLAVVHAAERRRPEVDEEASIERLRSRWEQSFAQVREQAAGVVGSTSLDDVERLTHAFLDGRGALFGARVERGCAVDGHGDLMADDIFCLEDGPRALDCLEFDDRLRFLDRIDDVCFLAMDLERLGAPDLGAAFVDWYVEFSGDDPPPALVHHYIAYRAFVRAKVACLRHAQGVDSREEIETCLEIARRHLAEGAVSLVLVGGPPGSGKTTVANGIADRLGMVVLSSDRVRKEMAGVDPTTSGAASYGEGIYSDQHTQRTYGELLERAEALLAQGESVVLDATWTRADARLSAGTVAERTSSDLVMLRCSAPDALANARITSRGSARVRAGLSDADVKVAETMREQTSPWPDARVVDTSREESRSVAQAVALVRPGTTARSRARRRPFLAPD